MAEITRRPRTKEEERLERALQLMREEADKVRLLAPFPQNLKHSLLMGEERVRRIKHEDQEHS